MTNAPEYLDISFGTGIASDPAKTNQRGEGKNQNFSTGAPSGAKRVGQARGYLSLAAMSEANCTAAQRANRYATNDSNYARAA